MKLNVSGLSSVALPFEMNDTLALNDTFVLNDTFARLMIRLCFIYA